MVKNYAMRLFLVFLLLLAPLPVFADAVWLWAGLSDADVPRNVGALYIYQGNVMMQNDATRFIHKGIYPYPMQRENIHLSLRLNARVPVAMVAGIYRHLKTEWETHHVHVAGLQLDYDCPTAKLDEYAAYLKELRAVLPGGTQLGVTGLVDWLAHAPPNSLMHLGNASDGIAFQFYQGRRALPHLDSDIGRLRGAHYPFYIGLLASSDAGSSIAALQDNPYYKGVLTFLQK